MFAMKSKSSSGLVYICLFIGFFAAYNCQVDAATLNQTTESTIVSTLTTTKTLSGDEYKNISGAVVNVSTAEPNQPITTTNPTKQPETTTVKPTLPPPPPETTMVNTTLPPETTTPSTTPATTPSTNTTTTTTPSTNTTTTTTAPDTTPSTNTTTTTTTTTAAPNTTTTVAPKTTTTAAPPVPQPCHHFDGPSFIGGIVLTLGLLAIGMVAYKFYKARNERNYHTL